jgi:RNA polymerase sigma factor (sigma-70 family)
MANAQLGSVLRHVRGLVAAGDAGCHSDAVLLRAFAAQQDQAAFAALVERHGALVLAVCRRVLHNLQDAEDAFQATFLLLARNAASLRQVSSLAGWLHGVAYRMACNARRAASRRRRHEGEVNAMPRTTPEWDVVWREVQSLLDEEIQRLPEIYRSAFVLCCLENKSGADAARALGVKEGTVGSRLNRARALLQQALARRGVALSAVLAATALSSRQAAAALPGVLVSSTVEAATQFAAAHVQAASVVSGNVAALLKGANTAMFLSKLKTGALSLFLLAIVGIGVGMAYLRAQTASPPAKSRSVMPAAPKGVKQAAPAASAEGKPGADAIKVAGVVLGPDGKPFQGAELFVLKGGAKKQDRTVKATTDKDGRFRISVSSLGEQGWAKLLATAQGHGPDWIALRHGQATDKVTLRLVKDDVPITGRVLDLEGRAIVGASVRVGWVEAVDLGPWLADRTRSDLSAVKNFAAADFAGPQEVKTNADGSFRLSGFGRDRVAHLFVRGKGIEDNDVEFIAREGPVAGLRLGHRVVHAPGAKLTILPSKPIIGTVRDKKTGKPLAGIRIVCPSRTWNWPGATTDKKGQYRVEGLGKRKEYMVAAGGLTYFNSTQMQVPDTEGLEPLTVDFDLEQGILFKGRLTDRVTGKPIRARVGYIPASDNPNLKEFTDLGKPQALATDRGRTNADGAFTVLCIPGPGLLAIRADDADAYGVARLPDGIKPGNQIIEHYNLVVRIDPSEKDEKSRRRDITLEPTHSISGEVVGPDGKPLPGVFAAGLHAVWAFSGPEKLAGASFKVYGSIAKEPRVLVLTHPEKKLAKVHKLSAEDKGPIKVRMEATGELAGRVVDSNGRPWAGLVVKASYRNGNQEQERLNGKDVLRLPIELTLEYPQWEKVLNREVTTDKDGKFHLSGLVPGLLYDLAVSDGQAREITRERLSVESGKSTALGDLKAANATAGGKKE